MTPLVGFLLARIGEDEFAIPRGECRCGNVQRPDCPDRITAECEAKRRVVERFARSATAADACGAGASPFVEAATGLLAVLDLATVYADHPDYRDEWRP